jgi:pimeloyl-ACP methyl ester carboxylesterase
MASLGDMDNTWINPDTHASWPDLIATDPDLKDFDVYVYGYSSPAVGEASNIREIADRFGQELKDNKIFANYEEVDFITHSMGGIITKRMLDTLNTPSENVNLHRVHCVIYLAVPSNGAELASLASWISHNPQFKSMSSRNAADFLQAVEGDWAAILRARNARSPFPRTYSAYEKLRTASFQVVPQLYTSQLADAPVLGFDYNHLVLLCYKKGSLHKKGNPRVAGAEPWQWFAEE